MIGEIHFSFATFYSLETLKLGFFIPWIRIRDPPNFGGSGSGSSAEKLADPGGSGYGSGSETLPPSPSLIYEHMDSVSDPDPYPGGRSARIRQFFS